MENLLQILDPLFIVAILSLTELIKRFFPSNDPKKIPSRLITIIATIIVAFSAYFVSDFSFAENLITSIASMLSAAGLYGLAFKPVKNPLQKKS
jgi:hypothetical protein